MFFTVWILFLSCLRFLLFWYIIFYFTDIIVVLLVAVIVYSIIIFPLSMNLYANVDFKNKKLFYGIYLFNLFGINKGKVVFSDGALWNVTKKKVHAITLIDAKNIKTNLEPFNDYHITSICSYFVLGGNTIIPYVTFAFTVNYFENMIKGVARYYKPYLKINNYTDVYTDKHISKLYLGMKIRFNLFVMVLSLIKIFLNFISEKKNEK